MTNASDKVVVNPWSDRLGICSVTLRHRPPGEVVEITREAGLSRIEWGADVHAPPTDLARVAEVRELTEAAGLTVSSYGSYWRAGVSPLSELTSVVAAAATLRAPRIRVWAGDIGTDQADQVTWERVVTDLRAGCAVARAHDIGLALEFHPDTLTDTVDTTLELLERVGDETLGTYWQPRLDEAVSPSVGGLRRLIPVLAGVHVFSWWPGANRLRLHDRSELWSAVVECLVREGEPCDLLLEFVAGDDPTLVAAEAATLHDLLVATMQ